MKAITPDNFKLVLQTAAILTIAQDRKDKKSIEIAHQLWQYIDACRRRYPYLQGVYL